ncbi:MAG: LAGLIDADG family homing endonuclease [Nitrospiraceae bacterium]|jgi:hypothetical protein
MGHVIYKRANILEPVHASYIAGLIDGEGTVTLTRLSRNRQRGLAVTISNTERDILEHVFRLIGVGKITNKRRSKSHHVPSYTYQITNRQALDLLKQICPYMRSHKSDRARLAVCQYVKLTPRNGRYTIDQLRERDKFVRQFFAIRPVVDNHQETSFVISSSIALP